MKKALSLLLYGLLAISLILTVLVFVLPDNIGVGIILYWTYLLSALTILAVLVFPVINIIQNPKAAMKSLMALGAIVVVVGVTYALSSSVPVPLSGGTVYTNVFGIKVTETSLFITYLAMVGAVVVTIYGEIRNSLK